MLVEKVNWHIRIYTIGRIATIQYFANFVVLLIGHSFSSQKINCMSVNKTILSHSDAPMETIEISSFNTIPQHCSNVSSFLLCRIHPSTNSDVLFVGHCILKSSQALPEKLMCNCNWLCTVCNLHVLFMCVAHSLHCVRFWPNTFPGSRWLIRVQILSRFLTTFFIILFTIMWW